MLVGLAGFGPVAGTAPEEGQLAIELLEPAALLLALAHKKQVAAIGAVLGGAEAAAEAMGAVLDRDGDPDAMRSARRIERNEIQPKGNQPRGRTRPDPLARVWD